jgi:HK97 family phage portal protein
MSIKGKFRDWLMDDAPQGKRVTQVSSVGWDTVARQSWLGGDAVWQDGADKLAKIYSKSGLIAACIREKATSLADVPLEVGMMNDGVFEPVPHEVLDLFYKNPDYSYSQIMGLTAARLDLNGAAYALLSSFENRFGTADFTPVPTHIVGKKTQGAAVTGYKIKTGDKEIPVEPEEMCALEYLDPSTFQGITSPTVTILKELGIDTERIQITMEILRNKALPGLFLRPEGNMSEPQRKQLRDSLNQAAGGDAANRGALTVLPSKINVEKGSDVTDIDFAVLNNLTETRICMAYGVPPIVLGAISGLQFGTYANYESARESFYSETMLPLWSFIESGLTRSILQTNPQTESLVFKFDVSKVTELQEDLNEISKRSALLFEKKVVTRDEAREMVGLPPVGGDDGGFMATPAPVVNVPTMGANDDQAEDMPDEEGKSLGGKIGQTEKAPAAIGSFTDSVALEQTLKREFAKQEAAAIQQLEELGYIQMSVIGKDLGKAIEATLLAIAQGQAMKQFRTLSDMVGKSANATGIQGKITDAAIENSFNVVNPLLERRMEAQAIELSESTLATTQKNLDDTLGALRKELVKEGVRGPNTVRALTEGVKRVFTNASDYRARMIAITESSRATNDANILSATASGVVQGFEPLISADACELCQVYEGANPTGKALFPFTNTEDAGKQVGDYTNRSLPPYHPNCLTGETPCFAIAPEAAFVSTYCGPVVDLTLSDGRRITTTINHMLLTPNGFAKAKFIRKGDYVLDASGFDRVMLGGPNNDGKPTSIQEVVETLAESSGVSVTRMPLSSEYLHGDASFCQGDIHIVAPNGFLKGDRKTLGTELVGQDNFQTRDSGLISLATVGDLDAMLLTMRDITDGGMGRLREAKALALGKSRHPELVGLGACAQFDSSLYEAAVNDWPADAKALANAQARFSGKVTTAKVVDVNVRDFLGHVYDLHTKSSLYIANGILSSNCRCTTVPVLITDPTPQAASAVALPQDGTRKSETPRPRPGGRPDAPKPLIQFTRNAVKEVTE